ncbi:MAG TPA: glycosyltransferase, partial [Bryobacteraceae bacterium]|nr:glycosyltransferase [Bryobacteraceae bacterium]
MPPITLLIFAYHFPPENSIGGQRPFRFYKYLSRMGYRCHVITAARQEEANPDVTHVPDPFIETQRDGAGWQVERFIRKFLLPGVVGVRWGRMAAKAGQAIIRANRTGPVAILSTFPPLGTHIAGWELSRREGVPWIADFRDPMGDNPGHVGFSQAQHGLYNSLEHLVFRSADLIIANTDTAADQWRARYPEKKSRIHLIWNGFDPENKLRPLPVPEHKRKVVSHVGSLYGGRTVTPLLESVARLIECGQLSRDSICINLVGEALPGCIPSPDFVDRAKS